MRFPDGISTWFMLLATIGAEACKRMEMLSPDAKIFRAAESFVVTCDGDLGLFAMLFPSPWVLGVVYGATEMVLSRIRRPGADAQVKDRSSFRVLLAVIWSCVFLSIIATYELGFARIHHASQYYPAGFALFVAGLALRWWSIIVLGRFFTVKVSIASDHRIVEKGPYRILRHPSYAGGLLAFLGLGICMSNWASIALLVIPTWFAYLWRIQVEEEALTEALGEEYRRYSARTYRLIPFVH